jgi:hypothetical protein
MNTIHIHKKLDSDTLHLPELKSWLGKTVEIIIKEETVLDFAPGTDDWVEAQRAAQELRESYYDFDAWQQQREYDLQHADDHIP